MKHRNIESELHYVGDSAANIVKAYDYSLFVNSHWISNIFFVFLFNYRGAVIPTKYFNEITKLKNKIFVLNIFL